MLNLDPTTLAAVAEQACRDAAQHGRWLVAIGRALVELETNPWIERADHGLLIGSPSGSVYSANGTCGCKAYQHGQPCWHRAAARLVRLLDEREAADKALADRVVAVVEQTEAAIAVVLQPLRNELDLMRAERVRRACAAAALINELFA